MVRHAAYFFALIFRMFKNILPAKASNICIYENLRIFADVITKNNHEIDN